MKVAKRYYFKLTTGKDRVGNRHTSYGVTDNASTKSEIINYYKKRGYARVEVFDDSQLSDSAKEFYQKNSTKDYEK